MITTVTLSPCIDKTIILDDFHIDKLNRAKSVRLDPGGKGVNVSLALAALEVPSRAVGFNFKDGGMITTALESAGASPEFIVCPGNIRVNTKIYVQTTCQTIEINEQNPDISEKNVTKLVSLIREMAGNINERDLFVLSGSIPPGVPSDIYRTLILEIKEQNPRALVILDCDGEALLKGLSASPYMIKPNVEELEHTFGIKINSDDDITALCRKIISEYRTGLILVSKGSEGAIAVTKNEVHPFPAMKISARSAQGAGDGMVAGACLALSKGLAPSDVIRCGICAAAGAVEREGTAFCERKRFEELLTEYGK